MKYKALSLNPPYGTLIAACERFPALGKHIETRGRWDYRHRGALLIHQTRGLGEMFESEDELSEFCDQEPFRTTIAALGYRDASELPRGAIVARAELAACYPTCGDGYIRDPDRRLVERASDVERAFGNYERGRKALLLADIHALPHPIPARGRPGLWGWEGEIEL